MSLFYVMHKLILWRAVKELIASWNNYMPNSQSITRPTSQQSKQASNKRTNEPAYQTNTYLNDPLLTQVPAYFHNKIIKPL
jgi:hypothetical protein